MWLQKGLIMIYLGLSEQYIMNTYSQVMKQAETTSKKDKSEGLFIAGGFSGEKVRLTKKPNYSQTRFTKRSNSRNRSLSGGSAINLNLGIDNETMTDASVKKAADILINAKTATSLANREVIVAEMEVKLQELASLVRQVKGFATQLAAATEEDVKTGLQEQIDALKLQQEPLVEYFNQKNTEIGSQLQPMAWLTGKM